VGTTQLPAILTLSTAIGLSTQCPTDSVNKCLLLETKVAELDDDDDDPTDAADVSNSRLLTSEAMVQLLLGDTHTVESQGYAATTSNKKNTNPSSISTTDNI